MKLSGVLLTFVVLAVLQSVTCQYPPGPPSRMDDDMSTRRPREMSPSPRRVTGHGGYNEMSDEDEDEDDSSEDSYGKEKMRGEKEEDSYGKDGYGSEDSYGKDGYGSEEGRPEPRPERPPPTPPRQQAGPAGMKLMFNFEVGADGMNRPQGGRGERGGEYGDMQRGDRESDRENEMRHRVDSMRKRYDEAVYRMKEMEKKKDEYEKKMERKRRSWPYLCKVEGTNNSTSYTHCPEEGMTCGGNGGIIHGNMTLYYCQYDEEDDEATVYDYPTFYDEMKGGEYDEEDDGYRRGNGEYEEDRMGGGDGGKGKDNGKGSGKDKRR